VDDFGALNSALPDPEPVPAEAVSGAAPGDRGRRSGCPRSCCGRRRPSPETAEGAPDAPAAAAPSAEDPTTVAAEATAETTVEATAEAPATAGSSQVA
jgi:hypothetical protein